MRLPVDSLWALHLLMRRGLQTSIASFNGVQEAVTQEPQLDRQGTHLHQRVDDVILPPIEVFQQAALKVSADKAAGCLPWRVAGNPGLQCLRQDADRSAVVRQMTQTAS